MKTSDNSDSMAMEGCYLSSSAEELISILINHSSLPVKMVGLFILRYTDSSELKTPKYQLTQEAYYDFIRRMSRFDAGVAFKYASKYRAYGNARLSNTLNGLTTDDLSQYDYNQILQIISGSVYTGVSMYGKFAQRTYKTISNTEKDLLTQSVKSKSSEMRVDNSSKTMDVESSEILKTLQNIAKEYSEFSKCDKNLGVISNYDIPYVFACVTETLFGELVGTRKMYEDPPTPYSILTEGCILDFCIAMRQYLLTVICAKFGKDLYTNYCVGKGLSDNVVNSVQSKSAGDPDSNIAIMIMICSIFSYVADYIVEASVVKDVETQPGKDLIEERSCLAFINQTSGFIKLILKGYANVSPVYAEVARQTFDVVSRTTLIRRTDETHLSFSDLSTDIRSTPYLYGSFVYSPKYLREVVIPAIKQIRGNPEKSSKYTDFISYGMTSAHYTAMEEIARNFNSGKNFFASDIDFSSKLSDLKIPLKADTPFFRMGSFAFNKTLNDDYFIQGLISRITSDTVIEAITNMHIEDPRSTVTVDKIAAFITYLSGVSIGMLQSLITSNRSTAIINNILNIGIMHSYRSAYIPMNKFQKEEIFVFSDFSNEGGMTLSMLSLKVMHEMISRANSREIAGQDITNPDQRYMNTIRYMANSIVNNSVNAEYILFHIINSFDYQTYSNERLVNPSSGGNSISDRHPIEDLVREVISKVGERTCDFFKIFHNPIVATSVCMSSSNPELINKSNDEMLPILKAYIEPIALITIIQNIALHIDMNESIDEQPKTIRSHLNVLTATKRIASEFKIDSKLGEMNTGASCIDADYHVPTTIIQELKNASHLIGTLIGENITGPDWYETHKDSIIQG